MTWRRRYLCILIQIIQIDPRKTRMRTREFALSRHWHDAYDTKEETDSPQERLMTGLQRVSRLAVVGLIDIGLVVIGVYGAAAFDHKGWLSFSVAALAIVTFFGFLQLGPVGSAEEQAPERVLRRAIAATAVLVYLVLVGLVAFFPLAGQPKAAPNPVTELLLTNFTAVVGTIVAFYFGSSAYLEARKKADKSSEAN